MRLRSYILVETALGVVFLASAFAGVAFAVEALTENDASVSVPLAQTRASIPSFETDPLAPATGVNFAGRDPSVLLKPLREQPLASVKLNRGGSSLSFRIKFADGSRAAFKPRQRFAHSNPRREVAAFRLNQLLRIGAVPPSTPRKFSQAEFYGALVGDSFDRQYINESLISDSDGGVRGELSWWIPEISSARVAGFPIDSTEGIITYKRYLRPGAQIPSGDYNMTRQIANVLLFDYLTNNPDRWSGDNAESSPDNVFLFFMDNTMSFGTEVVVHDKVEQYLVRSQRFSRSLVERVRGLTPAQMEKAINNNSKPFKRLLSKTELKYLEKRRQKLLDYIDQLIAKHGADEVLYFP